MDARWLKGQDVPLVEISPELLPAHRVAPWPLAQAAGRDAAGIKTYHYPEQRVRLGKRGLDYHATQILKISRPQAAYAALVDMV